MPHDSPQSVWSGQRPQRREWQSRNSCWTVRDCPSSSCHASWLASARCGCRASDYDDVATVAADAAADGDGSRRVSDPRRSADNDVRLASRLWNLYRNRSCWRNWSYCRVWPRWSPPIPLGVACTLGGSCCLTLRRAGGGGGGMSCGLVSFGHLLAICVVNATWLELSWILARFF